jgi:hypothetical protein
MKICTYCGADYSDEMTNCRTDGQPLVPSVEFKKSAFSRARLEKRVNVTGKIKTHAGKKGLIRRVLGDSLRINDGLAKLVLGENHLTLHTTLAGQYNVKYQSITELRKRLWWWEMSWEDSDSNGDVTLCSWNLKPFAEYIRKKMQRDIVAEHRSTECSGASSCGHER